METIDFEKDKPVFVHGRFSWYHSKEFQEKINNEQAENLPALKGVGCFIVKGDKEEYVLIDDKQNILDAQPFNFTGQGNMDAKIRSLKFHNIPINLFLFFWIIRS